MTLKNYLLTVFVAFYFTGNFFCIHANAQSFCYPDGNVIIYSNYDGGYLYINVDQNIPDLKIGVTTYEKCEIHIVGPYAANVTQVIYAGYNGNNDHCNPTLPTTAIYGVASNITSILLYPPVTWPNTNGYYYIICNYSCDSATNQGGCNTPDQIAHYYLTQFGGSLYYHYTQYGCWQDTFHVSSGGNCCIGASIIPPQNFINASFSLPNDTLCAKDSVTFFNTSTSSYPGGTTYAWTFGDGTPVDTNANPTHVYGAGGTYIVTLIASNSSGTASDTTQFQLTIVNCFTGITSITENKALTVFPNPVSGKCCFTFHLQNKCDVQIRIYDALGKVMLEKNIHTANGEWCFDTMQEQLQAGMYYIVVDVEGKRYGTKVMVE